MWGRGDVADHGTRGGAEGAGGGSDRGHIAGEPDGARCSYPRRPQALCEEDVPIAYFSMGGWFYGMTRGLGSKNAELRMRQFAAAADAKMPLVLARIWVASKIENQRTLLRRNHIDPPSHVLEDLAASTEQARTANSLENLLGVEGNAARLYFGNFNGMLRPRNTEAGPFTLDFNNRNRRPPKDPVNALLSYGYALLTRGPDGHRRNRRAGPLPGVLSPAEIRQARLCWI